MGDYFNEEDLIADYIGAQEEPPYVDYLSEPLAAYEARRRARPVVADEEVRELFGQSCLSQHIERIKTKDPGCTECDPFRQGSEFERFEDRQWERLGTYIADNDHLKTLMLCGSGLRDSVVSALFRGLTGSSSLTEMQLRRSDHFGPDGIRSIVPFLNSCPSMTKLWLENNEGVNTEAFDLLIESLDGGGIKQTILKDCSIGSLMTLGRFKLPKLRILNLEKNRIIDIPSQALANCTHLTHLSLSYNNIGEGGYRAVANLLRKEECSLTRLSLERTGMGDVEAEILADSLKCNKKLDFINVKDNGIGDRGWVAFLKLLNDVSSMNSAANSNHTIRSFGWMADPGETRKRMNYALGINRRHRGNPGAAGRGKILKTLLNREKRMQLSRLQGIEHSSDHYLFSGIDPVLLPNVLELAVQSGSQSELYQMLVAIAPDLFSLIDREAMLKGEMARSAKRIAAITAELATLNGAYSRMKKQLRTIRADGEEAAGNLSGNKRGREKGTGWIVHNRRMV